MISTQEKINKLKELAIHTPIIGVRYNDNIVDEENWSLVFENEEGIFKNKYPREIYSKDEAIAVFYHFVMTSLGYE